MPAGARPGATPLIVVVVPGGRGDRGDRLGVVAAATRQGFAVLYPTSDDAFWSLNHAQGTPTSTRHRPARPHLAGGCFDAGRISITGVSNGAGFAARMACALPGRFAAVVPVAAGYRALDPCPASARASFLDIHGTADTVVPYNGKRPTAPARSRATPRAGRAATAAPRARPRAPRAGSSRACATRLRRRPARRAPAPVGTDHGWPGAGPPLPDHNPSGLSATRELLRFVAARGIDSLRP